MATNIELEPNKFIWLCDEKLIAVKNSIAFELCEISFIISLTNGLRLKMAKAPRHQLNHRFEALRQVHYTKICTENPEGLQLETPKNRILQKVIQTVEVCVRFRP